MKNIKSILIVLGLIFCSVSAFAQFDKVSMEEILTKRNKSNADFKKMYVKTLDGEHKQTFDISWLKEFRFQFMDKVLVIRYVTADGEFKIFIPYAEIMKINTSKSAVDIIMKD